MSAFLGEPAPSSGSGEVGSRQAMESRLVHWSIDSGATERRDYLALEEPMEIRVQGRCVSVTMRTPGHDAELAAGFLLAEGVIRGRADVLEIAPCRLNGADSQNILNVFLSPSVEFDLQGLTRHVFASSSCGVCGKASIESIHQHFSPVSSHLRIEAGVLLELPDRLRARQKTFAQTGGLHAAAVFNVSGECLVLREDVGRHNAVDKAIGAALLAEQLPLAEHLLLVSGRASFEIMQKALAAGIPMVAAISAPSSLAVEFARESRQTLVGFLRSQGMNIYSEPQRVAHLAHQSSASNVS